MKNYIAKIERKSEKWGGGIKVTTDFLGVRANDENEAKKDFEKTINSRETIIYVLEESNVPAEDLEIYNNQ